MGLHGVKSQKSYKSTSGTTKWYANVGGCYFTVIIMYKALCHAPKEDLKMSKRLPTGPWPHNEALKRRWNKAEVQRPRGPRRREKSGGRGQGSGQPICLTLWELWGRFNDEVTLLSCLWSQTVSRAAEICGIWAQQGLGVCGQWRHQRPGLDLQEWVEFGSGERRQGIPCRPMDANNGRLELRGSARQDGGEQSQGSWHSIAALSHDPRQGLKTLWSVMLVGSIAHSVLYIWTIAPGVILGKPLVVLFGWLFSD